MTRSSFWAVAAFAMITSTPALACPGGMMGGGQQGGHSMGMHAMMHGQGQGRGLGMDMGMDHGQHMMGQGCGQGGGTCPMAGAAEQTSSSAPSDAHTDDKPAAKK